MIGEEGSAVLASLSRRGFEQAEVFAKRGRSRRFEIGPEGVRVTSAEEVGWAVRAGSRGASFYGASSGSPSGDLSWLVPEPGEPLSLPPPSELVEWQDAPESSQPPLGEEEGRRLLLAVAEKLEQEIPGAHLRWGALEDGASEVRISNSLGLDVSYRGRLATLALSASTPGPENRSVGARLTAVTAGSFPVRSIADRIVDLVSVRQRGRLETEGGCDLVLAPEVCCHLLAALAPAFVGPRRQVADFLQTRQMRVASSAVTLVDDGRHPGGALAAPVDGEGVANGPRVLVEKGRLGESIVPWDEGGPPLGCRRRAGWRDFPRVAPSHLSLAPCADNSASDLIEDLDDGYYLIGVPEATRLPSSSRGFSLPVCGFRVLGGKPVAPLSIATLVGDPRSLLHAIVAVARDMRFVPLDAMIGAPTVSVRGLQLVDRNT